MQGHHGKAVYDGISNKVLDSWPHNMEVPTLWIRVSINKERNYICTKMSTLEFGRPDVGSLSFLGVAL
jgi:hypothetical protein